MTLPSAGATSSAVIPPTYSDAWAIRQNTLLSDLLALQGRGGEGGVFDGQGQAGGNLGDFSGFLRKEPWFMFSRN